ncbi:MAG: DUF2141 domain-containing protein [Litorimonas sp.]
MFVKTTKTLAVAFMLMGIATFAHGTEGVPLTVTLTDVQATDVPLYISVQTKADYRSMKGSGAILETTESGTLVRTVTVPQPGAYAISIWHDLDNDGRFSMNERYEIQDGWATSGDVPPGVAPTFEQAKVEVPAMGATATVAMIHPEN